jgi:hypothetical protein
MASAADRLRILENVIARVGFGGDVFSEYTKALSGLNGMNSYNELTPPQPIQPTEQTPQGMIPPEPLPNPTPEMGG